MKVGKLSENIWKRSVRKMLLNHTMNDNGAGIGRDCALFSDIETIDLIKNDNIFCVSESCVVPFCEMTGALGVYLASNAVAGNLADVTYLMLSLFLDGNTSEEMMAHISKQVGEISAKIGIKIAGFDVHVLHGLKKPYLLANGIGQLKYVCSNKSICKDIVVVGRIALAGTSMLLTQYDRKELKVLEEYFPKKYLEKSLPGHNDLSIIPYLDKLQKYEISYSRALAEGGIFGSLWEMSESMKTGLSVDLKKIPIGQDTVEICNLLNINPYVLHSGGSMLVCCKDGELLADELQKDGVYANVIGTLTDSNDKIIVNDEEIRYITLPQTDEIYKYF